MSVWALAQPAMQQEAHLMFQSEARFSAGPHFPSVPACRFQHRAKGLLSFAPRDLEVVLIPVAPLVSVFQRSTLNTHPTSKLHIFLKSDEKCYLNKQKNQKNFPNKSMTKISVLEEQTVPYLACYVYGSFRSVCFTKTTFCTVQ